MHVVDKQNLIFGAADSRPTLHDPLTHAFPSSSSGVGVSTQLHTSPNSGILESFPIELS